MALENFIQLYFVQTIQNVPPIRMYQAGHHHWDNKTTRIFSLKVNISTILSYIDADVL